MMVQDGHCGVRGWGELSRLRAPAGLSRGQGGLPCHGSGIGERMGAQLGDEAIGGPMKMRRGFVRARRLFAAACSMFRGKRPPQFGPTHRAGQGRV